MQALPDLLRQSSHRTTETVVPWNDAAGRLWTAQDLGLQTDPRGSPAPECRPYAPVIYVRVMSLTTQAERPAGFPFRTSRTRGQTKNR